MQPHTQKTKVSGGSSGQRLAVVIVVLAVILLGVMVGAATQDAAPTAPVQRTPTPSPSPTSTPVPISTNNPEIFIFGFFDRSTTAWRIEARNRANDIVYSIPDGRDFVVSRDQQTLYVVLDNAVAAYHIRDGEQQWQRELDGVVYRDNNTAYIALDARETRLGIVVGDSDTSGQAEARMQWLQPRNGALFTSDALPTWNPRFSPFMSPDGRKTYYVSEKMRLEELETNGGASMRLPNDTVNLVMSRDGRWLYVLAGYNQGRLEIYNLETLRQSQTINLIPKLGALDTLNMLHLSSLGSTLALDVADLQSSVSDPVPPTHVAIFDTLALTITAIIPADRTVLATSWNSSESQFSLLETSGGDIHVMRYDRTLGEPTDGFDLHVDYRTTRVRRFSVVEPDQRALLVLHADLPKNRVQLPAPASNPAAVTNTLGYNYSGISDASVIQLQPSLPEQNSIALGTPQSTSVPTTWLRLASTSGVMLMAVNDSDAPVYGAQADFLVERREQPPLLFSTNSDGHWHITDPQTRRDLGIEVHTDVPLRGCVLAPDQIQVACHSAQTDIMLINSRTGTAYMINDDSQQAIPSGSLLIWTDLGIYGYSIIADTRVLWRIDPFASTIQRKVMLNTSEPDRFVVSRNDTIVYSYQAANQLRVRDAATNTDYVLSDHVESSNGLFALSPDGLHVAYALVQTLNTRHTFVVANLATFQQTILQQDHPIIPGSLRWSRDNQRVLWRTLEQVDERQTADRLWTYDRGLQRLTDVAIPGFTTINAAFSPDALAVVSYYGSPTPSLLLIGADSMRSVPIINGSGQGDPVIVFVE